MDNEKMIESIRALCKSENITPTKLEEKLGFSQGLISRWKDKTPNLDRIIDIANYFHVSIDEVVGREQIIEDDFICILTNATKNGDIVWNNCHNSANYIKRHPGTTIDHNDFTTYEEYKEYLHQHNEVLYYTKCQNGYILIYALYEKFKITTPCKIELFIQPEENAELVPQSYDMKDLLPLWLKVIYSVGDGASDEIKAEELKNNFVKNSSLEQIKNNPIALKHIYNEMIKIDPEIVEIINKLNTPEIQKIQQMFSDPGFRNITLQASKIAELFKNM